MKNPLLYSIEIYQFFSKDLSLWGSRCTFHPSCSEYGHEAIQTYGTWRGLGLFLKRIIRCRPGKEFSIDFLP